MTTENIASQPIVDAPITPESVAGEQPPSVPDRSIVADRLNAMFVPQKPEEETQSAEYLRLAQEIAELKALRGDVPKPAKAATDDIGSLRQELAALRERQETWEQQLQRQREQESIEMSMREVSAWVEENKQEFPLINKLGEQRIVFQKMYQSRRPDGRMISEAEAARQSEADIRAIVEQCAPLLGYTKSNGSRESEDQVTINSAMSVGEPVDRTKMSDDQYLAYLVRQAQGH